MARVREFGVCVQSVSICANQPETERAALQEPRLLKILCLVPVVWLLECVFSAKATKQKEKKKELARAACVGAGGMWGRVSHHLPV